MARGVSSVIIDAWEFEGSAGEVAGVVGEDVAGFDGAGFEVSGLGEGGAVGLGLGVDVCGAEVGEVVAV